jgi:hypothetical protein
MQLFVNLEFEGTPRMGMKQLPLHLALHAHDQLWHVSAIGEPDVRLDYLEVSIGLWDFGHAMKSRCQHWGLNINRGL